MLLDVLANLSERELLRYFIALRNASRPEIVEEQPDPVMVRLAEEYRNSGGFKPRPVKPDKEPSWYAYLSRDTKGKVEKGVLNGLVAMREDPALSGILGYDPQVRKIVLKARLPDDWEPDFCMREITESDCLSLWEYLTRHGLRLTKDEMRSVIRKVAQENPLGEA